jgi:hypothetical protein
MNMRIARLSLLLAAAASLAALHAQDDVVMKAMRDEMARSMKELTLENLEKPYFIAYRVVDNDTTGVAASFGARTAAAPPGTACSPWRCAWAITSSITPTSSP